MMHVIYYKSSSIIISKMNQNRERKKKITPRSRCLKTGVWVTSTRQSSRHLRDSIHCSGHPPLTVFFFDVGEAGHGAAQLLPHCVHVPRLQRPVDQGH